MANDLLTQYTGIQCALAQLAALSASQNAFWCCIIFVHSGKIVYISKARANKINTASILVSLPRKEGLQLIPPLIAMHCSWHGSLYHLMHLTPLVVNRHGAAMSFSRRNSHFCLVPPLTPSFVLVGDNNSSPLCWMSVDNRMSLFCSCTAPDRWISQVLKCPISLHSAVPGQQCIRVNS